MKIKQGEKLLPSQTIDMALPLPLDPELIQRLEGELSKKSPENFTARDIDLVIKISRAERKIAQAARVDPATPNRRI